MRHYIIKQKWQEEPVRLNVRVQEKFVEFHGNGNLEVVEFHRNGNLEVVEFQERFHGTLEKVEEKEELKREFQEK